MTRESEILAYRQQYKNLFNKYLRKYSKYGLDLDDIRSEMDIALIQAYEHFDESRGVDFGLCLSFWVKEALMKYSAKNKKIVSVNAAFVVKKDKTEDIKAWQDFEIMPESEAFTVKDDSIDIERSVYEKEIFRKIHQLLSGNELTVLLDRLNGKSLQDIGEKLGKSRERIRQIENAGLKRFTNKINHVTITKKEIKDADT